MKASSNVKETGGKIKIAKVQLHIKQLQIILQNKRCVAPK